MSGSSSISSSEGTKRPVVLCDMCTEDDRRAALKTCMKCEISMCVQHLQPHLTTPVLLLAHPLTEPMSPGAGGLGGTKCPQHGKILEYYCLDDLTSVCVSCAIEDQHRLHNMKTLPKAHAELVEKLADGERAVAERRIESGMLGNWEESQREGVGRSGVRLVEAVNKLRDIALNRVRSSVSARMGSITTGGSSIQVAKDEKDTFRFLQLYSQVHQDVERAKAVDLRTGLETGEERDKLVQELQGVGTDMMAQATELWGSVLMFVDPENHKKLSRNAMATFDPLTLGTGMSLSEDHRKVFYGYQSGTIPQLNLTIKSSDSLSIHRWTIAVSEYCDWTIGFCDQQFANRYQNGYVYALSIQDAHLTYLTTDTLLIGSKKETKTSSHVIPGAGDEAERMARPETVEVFWSPVTSSLSFFTWGLHYQRRLIVSFDVSHSDPPLNPFVKLQSKAVQGPKQTTRLLSNQWRCSCGKMYTKQNDDYHSEAGKVSRCVCGRVTGTTPITDVLCELL